MCVPVSCAKMDQCIKYFECWKPTLEQHFQTGHPASAWEMDRAHTNAQWHYWGKRGYLISIAAITYCLQHSNFDKLGRFRGVHKYVATFFLIEIEMEDGSNDFQRPTHVRGVLVSLNALTSDIRTYAIPHTQREVHFSNSFGICTCANMPSDSRL